MNENLKNAIGVAIFIATLSLGYAAFRGVGIYDRSSEPSNFRSFSVQAEGSVTASPDVATFTFSVITEGGDDVAKLQNENTDKMNNAIAFVNDQGVAKADIKTQQYQINPRYQTSNCSLRGTEICPPAEIVGYSVRQSAEVKIRDFELISDLLSGVVKNGANSVSQIQFTIDDPTELEHQAREEAIKKAQEKAEMIADSGDFTLGRLLEINEDFYSPMPYANRSYALDEASAGIGGGSPSVPSIEPGSQEVSIRVYMRYEIQ